ncbi:hypothetical protein Tco_1272485 [Tanacetum coccineum]
MWNNVANIPSFVPRAASVPAGSRNQPASVTAGSAFPAGSRNRPATVLACQNTFPASSSTRPALVSGGYPKTGLGFTCHILGLKSGLVKSLANGSTWQLREQFEADVALANNLLDVLTRYLEQMHSRGPKMLRVESSLAHPLIIYNLHTLQRTNQNDVRNSSNLVAARNELLRTIAEKEELIRVYRAM